MQRTLGALALILVCGCPSERPKASGKAGVAGRAAGKAPDAEAKAPRGAPEVPAVEAKAAPPAEAKAVPEPAPAPAPAPAADTTDPVQRTRGLLALDGPTMSRMVPWRDENRLRLMSRLASVAPAIADSMLTSLDAVDNEQVAQSFEKQFASRWVNVAACEVVPFDGPAPKVPAPELLAKLPADFGGLAERLEGVSFVEVRCEDGRRFRLGWDAKGLVSARDTTPKGPKK